MRPASPATLTMRARAVFVLVLLASTPIACRADDGILNNISHHHGRMMPNSYHPTSAIWGALKRCDMLDYASELYVQKARFGSKTGGWQYLYPSYTLGTWVTESAARPSIAATMPVVCDQQTSMSGTSLGLAASTSDSTVESLS